MHTIIIICLEKLRTPIIFSFRITHSLRIKKLHNTHTIILFIFQIVY